MSASPDNCFHLTVEIVREIHAEAIARFGGSDGVRDSALLESAVAAPQASFGGRSPYRDLTEVAAAYLYYLCRNHPFIDGNKRAALGSCIVFIRLNGIEPKPDGPEWEELILAIASGKLDREQATIRLRELLPTGKEIRGELGTRARPARRSFSEGRQRFRLRQQHYGGQAGSRHSSSAMQGIGLPVLFELRAQWWPPAKAGGMPWTCATCPEARTR